MDEFQNYEKALGALGESYKCLSKAQIQNEELKEERMQDLKHRVQILKKYVQLKRFTFCVGLQSKNRFTCSYCLILYNTNSRM